jgi:uncharacterized protein YuzE
MPISAEYDPEADALYIRIRDGERSRAVELDERHYIDVDAEGKALGLEVLYPEMGVRVTDLARTWRLPADELATVITTVLGRSVPMTTTAATDVVAVSYATVSAPAGAPVPVPAAQSISVPSELVTQ